MKRLVRMMVAVCAALPALGSEAPFPQAVWRYTLIKPANGWQRPGFDDGRWQQGKGGFGTPRTPGARVGTKWTARDIWLRRRFEWAGPAATAALLIHHDEDAEVFVNGVLAGTFREHVKRYQAVQLTETARKALLPGSNLLAVHCRQTRGGQFIDVHVLDRAEATSLAAGGTVEPTPPQEAPPSDLMTPWGEKVTAETAWREYPRPQMVRPDWLCLNGLWDFSIVGRDGKWTQGRVANAVFDPLLNGVPELPSEWPDQILVPFSPETQLSGVRRNVRPNQLLWYRRRFTVPEAWQGRTLLLHFEAVDWHAVVLLNGRAVGENKGGYIPFTCDLSDALQADGEQELVVVAWDPTNMGDQAVGKQALPELRRGFRYTPNSGIWQSVWLEPVPKARIDSLKIIPDWQAGAVRVAATVGGLATKVKVKVTALDGDREVAAASGGQSQPITLRIPDPKAWSPDDPHLYSLRVEYAGDAVTSYFGLRRIDVAPDDRGINRIRLNGKPIFQFGPLDQGYWPDGALTPPSDEAAAYDVRYLKQIGCNMVRVHVKVHSRRWYYHCDRMGLLVWQDFVCTRKFDKTTAPASTKQWELEQRRMLDHLRNHPSVVTWIVFNEGWGQFDTERLTKWVMAYDPTRLVTCASGWTDEPVGHIYDTHDYSFNISPAHGLGFRDRATLCGECGGFNVLLPGHLWHRDQTQRARVTPTGDEGRENYESVTQWEGRYRTWLTNLRLLQRDGLNAAVYTQISDVEHECNGWLTYDRKVSKFPVAELSKWHRQLYQPVPITPVFEVSAGTARVLRGAAPEGWFREDFRDATWAPLAGAKPGALEPLASLSDGNGPIRLRATVTLAKGPGKLALHTVGGGRWELFVNGEQVMSVRNNDRAGHVPYSTVLLPATAVERFRAGPNTVALSIAGSPRANPPPALCEFALWDVAE